MAFLIGGANSAADTGYEVANSCRFNDGDTANLYKTQASTTSTKKFTISFWVKRCGGFGSAQVIIGIFEDTSNYGYIRFTTSNELQLRDFYGEGPDLLYTTNMQFSDPSAWYNCVVAVDSDRTSNDRARIFVNGSQVSCSATTDTGGTLGFQSSTVSNKLKIGAIDNSEDGIEHYFDGYLAEFFYLDGQFLAASSFGEFNSDSPTIWQPIDASGLTFGDAGFYLDFEDSSNLGNDANGGTDFTATNLAAIDQTADTPTNNWCTYNPLYKDANRNTPTVADGNLDLLATTGSTTNSAGTHAFSTGKWYYEIKWLSGSGDNVTKVGWGNLDQTSTPNTASIVYRNSDGNKYIDNTGSSYGDTWVSANDIISTAIDLDSGTKTVQFWKNGSDQGSITISGKLDDGGLVVPYMEIANQDRIQLNFGNPLAANSSDAADDNGYGAFEYAPPSGFLALNSKNLGGA